MERELKVWQGSWRSEEVTIKIHRDGEGIWMKGEVQIMSAFACESACASSAHIGEDIASGGVTSFTFKARGRAIGTSLE